MEILPGDTHVQECPVSATSPVQKKFKLDCSVDWRKSTKAIDFVEGYNVYKHDKDTKTATDLVDNVDEPEAQSLQGQITPLDTVEQTMHGMKEKKLTTKTVGLKVTPDFFYSNLNINNFGKLETKFSDVTINAVICHETKHLDVTNSSNDHLGAKSSEHLAMQNDLLRQANGESDIFGSHSCCTNERGDVCDTISPMSNIVFDENTVKVCQEATVLTQCVENVLSSVNKALTNDREECKLDKDDHISEYVACESIKMLETDKQTSLTCVKSCMPVCSSEGKPEQAPCGVNGCNIVTYQEKQSIPEVNQTGTTKKYGPVRGGRTVVYVHSDEYMQLCDAMIRVPGRACMVHRLIEAYGLLKYLCTVPPSKLTREEILKFHSEEYVDVLERLDRDGEEGYDEQAQRCGLGYDCPAEPGMYEYATSVAGATVTAAQCLMEDKCTVAINWFGGWHHAKKDQASGFCYVNDIVLGILKLREKYQRVLYIDLDLHHGDGVEDAFSATSKVFTLSFHKYSAGFFPGTGSVKDVGFGKGRFFSLNIPLLDGIQDQQFFSLFLRVVEKVREVFSPEAVVCQCGADGLAGDPMNSFNLTHLSLGRCVYSLLKWNVPLLLLGGGGYEHANTARCWTFITSIAAFKKLPEDIPDHQYFTEYGPSYELAVTAGYRKNLNTPEYLKDVCRKVLGILQKTSKILAYNEVV